MNKNFNTVGLDFSEVRELLDGKRLSKAFKIELGNLATAIDTAIRQRTFEVYKVDQDKLRSASNIASTASIVTSGERAFKISILYKHQVTGLVNYTKAGDWRLGNLYLAVPEPKRQGRIQNVMIKRGRPKDSTGKVGRGGFLVKDKRGYRRLIERKTSTRKLVGNTVNLLAPSPAMLANYLIQNDIKLQKTIAVAEDSAITVALNYYLGNK